MPISHLWADPRRSVIDSLPSLGSEHLTAFLKQPHLFYLHSTQLFVHCDELFTFWQVNMFAVTQIILFSFPFDFLRLHFVHESLGYFFLRFSISLKYDWFWHFSVTNWFVFTAQDRLCFILALSEVFLSLFRCTSEGFNKNPAFSWC